MRRVPTGAARSTGTAAGGNAPLEAEQGYTYTYIMRLHDAFEWDEAKARLNLNKHRVSFEVAAVALADELGDVFHVNEPQSHPDEERWLTFVSHPGNRNLVLAIVWMLRTEGDTTVTRLISARKAERQERRRYEEAIYG